MVPGIPEAGQKGAIMRTRALGGGLLVRFAVLLVVIGTVAAVALAPPKPPKRVKPPKKVRPVKRRVHVKGRPQPAPRPWKRVVKVPKVIRKVPPLKPVKVVQPVTVVNTGTTDTGSGRQVKPVDTDERFASSTAYEVKSVADDGLTAVLSVDGVETKVRMIGIAPMALEEPEGDAPNGRPMRPRRSMAQPFLMNLLEGESVYVVYDSMVSDQDEEGRYVGYLYRSPDGLLINLEAVRQGFCATDAGYDFEEKDTFLYYQSKARRLGKGMWRMGRRGAPPRERRPRRTDQAPS